MDAGRLIDSTEKAVFSSFFAKTVTVLAFAGIIAGFAALLPVSREFITRLVENIIIYQKSNVLILIFFEISGAACLTAFVISLNYQNRSGWNYRKAQIPLSILLVVLVITFIAVFFYQYGNYWINSDSATELLGGKILSEENALFSSKWYYTTEFFIVYRQPMTILLFKLTGSWALVRAFNAFFQLLFLTGAYLIMMRQFKVDLKYCLFSSLFLLIPLSYGYWKYQSCDFYYFHFFIKEFLLSGLFIALINGSVKNGRKCRIIFICLCFLAGLEGIRILYSFIVPLIIAVFFAVYSGILERGRFLKKFCVLAFVSALTGCFVNLTLLHRFIHVSRTGFNGRFDPWSGGEELDFFNKLSGIVFGIYLDFFGYKLAHFFQPEGVLSGIALLLFITTIVLLTRFVKESIKKYPKPFFGELKAKPAQRFLLLYFISAVLFHLLFFQIALGSPQERYFYPALIFLFPCIAVMLEVFSNKLRRLYFTALVTVLCVFLFGSGIFIFYNNSKAEADKNSGRRGYIEYLLENHLFFGFADFWEANITTELSNGKIEIVGLHPAEPQDEIKRWEWGSPVKYDNPGYYKGASFLLFAKAEWEARKTSAVFSNSAPSYDDGKYVILVYPDAETIRNEVIKGVWGGAL